MTTAERKVTLESLDRLGRLYRRFEDQPQREEENAEQPFPRFLEVIGLAEERVRQEEVRLAAPAALAVWDAVLTGAQPAEHLSPLMIDRLCAIPRVAMSQPFLTFFRAENRQISEWGLIGLIRSYHQEWADLPNRLGLVELIRSRIPKGASPRSPRVRVWKANLRCLVDANDVDNLSLESISGRLTPAHLSHRFAIDEDSSFMSAVVATGIRRVCQKHRPTADDIDFLARGLLSYRFFRPTDLGRALANVLTAYRVNPPHKVRTAVERLAQSHSALKALPEHQAHWPAFIDGTGEAPVEAC